MPEEQLGSPITWVAAELLQVWRQIPVWLLFFLLSKAQAASSAVRPVAANLLSAVLKLPPAKMSFLRFCKIKNLNSLFKRSYSHQESTCKYLVKSPSGLLIAILQKQLQPDERDGNGQAILTRSMHLNAAMDVALCTTGECVGDQAKHKKHDYHPSLHEVTQESYAVHVSE